LPYLVSLGRAFGILNVDSWVSRPGRLVDPVTTAELSWWSEIVIANPAEIPEAHIFGIAPDSFKDGSDIILIHDIIIDTNVKIFVNILLS
jgi:hypothetical protein